MWWWKNQCHLKSSAKNKLSKEKSFKFQVFFRGHCELNSGAKGSTIIFAKSMEITLIKEMASSFHASVHYLPEFTKSNLHSHWCENVISHAVICIPLCVVLIHVTSEYIVPLYAYYGNLTYCFLHYIWNQEKTFWSCPKAHTCSEAHPASYSMYTWHG